MKQLLLRVPEELHARLAARAAREGSSVNQLATHILDTAVDADRGNRTAQLRAQAAAQGVLEPLADVRVDAAARRRALRGMEGLSGVVDAALADDRERS